MPSITAFYPLGGTEICTALQNFSKFRPKPQSLFTCAGPDLFSDTTKSIVCLQEKGRTEMLTV